ncbi:hypothetical protein BJH93_13230 [Kocuria polaris]|nr:hypothetical protein [Kocuria polaris]
MSVVLGAEIEAFRYAEAAEDALAGVGLEVAAGALVGIVGAAGSGKSTLGAVAAGLLPRATHGSEADGHDGDRLTARLDVSGQRLQFGLGGAPRIDVGAWARRVGLLPQDARHYFSGVRATVREELAFGLENAGVPRARMSAAVDAVADELGIAGLLAASPERISGGQERLVAIAALAVAAPAVLVLDEPLAGLDAHVRAEVVGLVARLRARGTAVVVLAAEFDELIRAADVVHVLSGGRTVAAGTPDAVMPTAGAHGVLISTEAPGEVPGKAPGRRGEDVLLEFEGVRLRHRSAAKAAVDGLDLQVGAGCCTALLGPNGAGKTTVLKAAAGLLAPEAGRVRAEQPGLLLQNPADQLFERTVEREVGFGLAGGRRNPAVADTLARLGLENAAGAHPYELPASQRRLVALASVLARHPRVLLLDEPTVALDAAGRRFLMSAIWDACERGAAVLVSTHDESFAAAVAQESVRLTGREG